jgi:hypothetical protein
MTHLEQRLATLIDTLATIADNALSLKTQLFELNKLREQVGKAQYSAEQPGDLYANREVLQSLQ